MIGIVSTGDTIEYGPVEGEAGLTPRIEVDPREKSSGPVASPMRITIDIM
jgi:hypothetical protein